MFPEGAPETRGVRLGECRGLRLGVRPQHPESATWGVSFGRHATVEGKLYTERPDSPCDG